MGRTSMDQVNTTDELPSGNDIKLDSICYVEDEKNKLKNI